MLTKGEWYVERNKTCVYAYDPIVPVFIADCGQHGNAEANARLIAQAPRMYEALKELMERFNGGVRFPLQSTCDKANKAIAGVEEK